VLLAGAREEVVAGAQLDAADAHRSRENHDLLGAFVRVAGKPRSSGQPNDGRAAARFVVAKEAPFDPRVVRGFPLAIRSFLDEHDASPRCAGDLRRDSVAA